MKKNIPQKLNQTLIHNKMPQIISVTVCFVEEIVTACLDFFLVVN